MMPNQEEFVARIRMELNKGSADTVAQDLETRKANAIKILKAWAKEVNTTVTEMYRAIGDPKFASLLESKFGSTIGSGSHAINTLKLFADALSDILREEKVAIQGVTDFTVLLELMGEKGEKAFNDIADSVHELNLDDKAESMKDLLDRKDELKAGIQDLMALTGASATELQEVFGKGFLGTMTQFEKGEALPTGKFDTGTLKILTVVLKELAAAEKEEAKEYETASKIRAKWESTNEQVWTSNMFAKRAAERKASGEATTTETSPKALTTLGGIVDNVKEKFGSLDGLASVFFGTTLANLGVQAVMKVGQFLKQMFQKVIQYMKEAIDKAIQFDQRLFALQAGIRALQRQGGDITFAGVTKDLNNLKETYKVFSEEDLVKGASKGIVMLRQMGITAQQTSSFLEASAKVAVIAGQSFEDTAEDLAIAIATGYSRTAKRLGLAYGPSQLNVVAAQMYGRSYKELAYAEKMAASMALIEKELAPYGQDIAEYAKTYVGELASANAKLEEAKIHLGEDLLPLWANIVDQVSVLVNGLLKADERIVKLVKVMTTAAWNKDSSFGDRAGAASLTALFANPLMISAWYSTWSRFVSVLDSINPDLIDKLQKHWETLANEKPNNAWYQLLNFLVHIGEDEIDLSGGPIGTDVLSNLDPKALAEMSQADRVAFDTMWGNIFEKIRDLMYDKGQEIKNMDRELHRDLLDMEEEYWKDVGRLEEDHLKNLKELNEDETTAEQRAYDDLQADLVDMDEDYRDKLKELDIDAKNDALEREIEFQNDLQSLRDNAFFDLEEAIRTGDARQARMILRKYKFDREQMLKDQEIKRQEDARNNTSSLTNAEREYLQRKARRMQDYNDQIIDLRKQLEREREEENIAYLRRLEDEKEAYDQKIVDRHEQYVRELEDLDWRLQQEFDKFVYNQALEYGATQTLMDNLNKLIMNTFGPNGVQFNVMNGYYDWLAMKRAAAFGIDLSDSNTQTLEDRALELLSSTSSVSTPMSFADYATRVAMGYYSGGHYAKGGTFVAKRPTVIEVGEQGEELVSITPISKISQGIGMKNDMSLSSEIQATLGGRARIEILLSPDLQGRIIENTLSNLDSIIEAAERQQ
jgi:hypothetical protein